MHWAYPGNKPAYNHVSTGRSTVLGTPRPSACCSSLEATKPGAAIQALGHRMQHGTTCWCKTDTTLRESPPAAHPNRGIPTHARTHAKSCVAQGSLKTACPPACQQQHSLAWLTLLIPSGSSSSMTNGRGVCLHIVDSPTSCHKPVVAASRVPKDHPNCLKCRQLITADKEPLQHLLLHVTVTAHAVQGGSPQHTQGTRHSKCDQSHNSANNVVKSCTPAPCAFNAHALQA